MSNTGCEAGGFATETKCPHQSINISFLIQPEGTSRLYMGNSSGEIMIGIPSVQISLEMKQFQYHSYIREDSLYWKPQEQKRYDTYIVGEKFKNQISLTQAFIRY
jgi:hypothetical protein